MSSKKDKKTTNNTTAPVINQGTYEQQMANTIAMQQQQLQMLAGQMYPGKGSNLNTENNNIINVGQSAPVVDGGIAGKDYYSSSPMTFVAPNMESRNRVAAASVNEFKTNENFINNFDSYMASFKNLPGINDKVYNELVKNAYSAIDELSDRDDLENISRHINTLSGNITNKWGGAKLNQSYNDYYAGLQAIKEAEDNYTGEEVGGYAPHMAKFIKDNYNANFKGVTKDENGIYQYNTSKPNNLIEYQNFGNVAFKNAEGWLADIGLTKNEDGTYKTSKLIPGYEFLKINETVDEGTVRNMLLRNLQSKGFKEYANQEAGIKMYNTLNTIKQGVAEGRTDTESMAEILKGMRAAYSSKNDATYQLLANLDKGAKEMGTTPEEVLLSSPGMLHTLMYASYQDDIVGPAANKFSYTKETLKEYADHAYLKELDLEFQLKLEAEKKARGYGTYYEGNKKTNSDDPDGLVGAQGPDNFAAMILSDSIDMFSNYGLETLEKFYTESETSFKTSKEQLAILERERAQGNKDVTDAQLANARTAVAKADEQLTYFTSVKNNMYSNIHNVFSKNNVNIEKEIDKAVASGAFKSKKQAKDYVIDLTNLVAKDGYSKWIDTGAFNELLIKYDLQNVSKDGKYTVKKGAGGLPYLPSNKVDSLTKVVTGTVNKLDKEGKFGILSPQIDLKYLAVTGETSKNEAQTAYNNSKALYKTAFTKSADSFKVMKADGTVTNFTQGIEELLGLKTGELWSAIDQSSLDIDPLLTKDYILDKASNGGTQLYLSFAFDRNSQVYKDNKDALDKYAKSGRFKTIVTADANNSQAFNYDVSMRLQNVFNDLASRKGFQKQNPQTLRALGMGYANTTNLLSDLNKFTFYDLNPGNARTVKLDGEQYAISTVKSNYFSDGAENLDFRINRATTNDSKGHFSETLALNNETGLIEWISSATYNAGRDTKNPSNNKYTFFTANTPQDIVGVLGAFKLQSQLNNHNRTVMERNGQLANGGHLKGGSSYPMKKEYHRMAHAMRYAESSNNYNSTPKDKNSMGIAYGAYQIVPSQHLDVIKEKYPHIKNIDDFVKDPVTQDKYFEYLIGTYDNFLNKNNRGYKLIKMLREYYPNANMDYARTVVHFWGPKNVDKLFRTKNPYTVHSTRIKYGTDKKTGKDLLNPTLVGHLKKFNRAYR